MPGFDKTGPMGDGPFTGGGRGFCNPDNTEYRNQVPGRAGFGRGLGLGFRGGRGSDVPMRRGFGRGLSGNQPRYYDSYTGDAGEALSALRAEVDSMKSAFDDINKRIDELEIS